MDRTHVNCLAFLLLLLGMSHVACATRVVLNGPGRMLPVVDLTPCYAAYDAAVNALTTAAKDTYNNCIAALGAPEGLCRTNPASRACRTGLTTCWNNFKTASTLALDTTKADLDACIANLQAAAGGR